MTAHADSLLVQAQQSEQVGELERAAELLQQLLAEQPDHCLARNRLGNVLRKQGCMDLAVAQFKQAVALMPDASALRNNLGSALAVTGAWQEAAEQFKQAIVHDPSALPGYQNLLRVYQVQGDLQGAQTYFFTCFQKHPESVAACQVWAMVLMTVDRVQEAEAVLSRVFQTNPEQVEVCELYAAVLKSQGKIVETIPVYQQALQRHPHHIGLLKGLARTYMARQMFDEAALCWKRVLDKSPDDANAHIDYGFVRACTGDARRKQWIAQLDEDTVYADVSEAKALAMQLVQSFPLSDDSSRAIAAAIMDELQFDQVYSHHWWQTRLHRFDGKGDDKVLRGVTSMVLSWSLPVCEALERIAGFADGQCIFSYGAGGAYWEYLLQRHFSCVVKATDMTLGNRFMEVEQLDMNTAVTRPGDTVFISWIRTVASVGEAVMRLLDSMQVGQKLVIVGDHPKEGGIPRTCGTRALFAYLAAHFALQDTIQLPHYRYMHDAVCLFVKK